MGWSDPRTWVNDEIPTQTELNTHVRDNFRETWHEVAYVEFTADVALTTTVADVVSSGAITYVANPTLIEFYCCEVGTGSTGSATVTISLYDGVTDLGIISLAPAITNGNSAAVSASRRLTPTAASHTYKVRALCSAGTNNVRAGAGGAATRMPGYIRVLQKGGA